MNDTDQLSCNLMKHYNKLTRGTVDQDRVIDVTFSFHMTSLAEFDEVQGKLSVVGFFQMNWVDDRMVWNPDMYNRTKSLLFKKSDVWTPRILLGNSHEKINFLGGDKFLARYSHKGLATWRPGDIFISFCNANIEKYPYDTQECQLLFAAWGYSKSEVRLISKEAKTRTDLYTQHGLWDIKSSFINTIECPCDFDMELMRITLQLSRRPTFYLVNMILPIIILEVLNLFVFILPADSGERVGYSITVLLSIAVYQTIASDNLPNVSLPNISYLCVKLLTDICISSLVSVFTIVGLTFYHKSDDNRIPYCLSIITRCVLCRRDKGTNTKNKYKYENEMEYNVNSHRWTIVKVPDENSEEIRWSDVGKASDILFCFITSLALISSNIVFLMLIL